MPLLHITFEHTAIRVPAFIPWAPHIWFQLLEHYFNAAGISDEEKKYYYAFEGLDTKHKSLFAKYNNKSSKTYQRLKIKALKIWNVSQKLKAVEWLQLASIDNEAPSLLLKIIRGLLTAGHFSEDDVTALWESKLPVNVQTVIREHEDLTLDQRAALADTIVLVHGSREVVAEESSTSTDEHRAGLIQYYDLDKLASKNDFVTQLANALSIGLKPLLNTLSVPDPAPEDLCWYHVKYGCAARNCLPPCNGIK